MKRKELKNLAQKIAKLEKIVQTSENEKEKKRAQDEIMHLSGNITNYEDIFLIDELVQEFLEKS